ncbi:MAG TPA: hypothetical protein VL856_05915 [Acidimicrobiia bacterium]|jgi:hypothetical protein|nr:hypothetical protein [Acidimicrobiia bacterium]
MSERSGERGHNEPTQLRLLPGGDRRPDWVLDEHTRRVGRHGVAQAREVLRRAQPPVPEREIPARKAS